MRRSKRLKIVRISLAMAVAAIIPVTAQAKPIPASGVGSQLEYQLKAVPVVTVTSYGSEREYQAKAAPVVESGATSSDDRPFSRAPILESTPVTDDGGSTFDVNPYVVSGLGVAFLLALGMALAIRHNRKTKLSPA
jgi:hypothetical protein